MLRGSRYRVAAAPTAVDLSADVRASLVATPPVVAPGATSQLRLALRNLAELPLTLGLTAHAGPMLTIEATGPDGAVAIDGPLPRPGFPSPVAVTLAPGQALAHTLTWVASIRPGTYRIRIAAMFDWAGHGLREPEVTVEVVAERP